MAQNKRQHWVPQFYLRHFATPETRESTLPKIWATPLLSSASEVFKAGIKDIANKAYLYSPMNYEGLRDDRVDERLQELESAFSGLWPWLANEHCQMDDEFRKRMSVFLATLILRNPYTAEVNKEIHQAIVAAIDASPKGENGHPLHPYIMLNGRKIKFDPSTFSEFRQWNDNDHRRSFATSIEQQSGHFARLIMEKKPWWICFSERPVFATSDYPVACYNPENKLPGLGRSDTVIHFPISPTRVLVIGDPSKLDGSCNPLKDAGEGYLNSYIYRAAKKWLFTCDEPTELLRNMLPYIEANTGHFSPDEAIRIARSLRKQ